MLYFYPMDDTPGCTAQACSLRDFNRDIAAKGAAILGVSSQDEASHKKFTSKHKLNFPPPRRHRPERGQGLRRGGSGCSAWRGP